VFVGSRPTASPAAARRVVVRGLGEDAGVRLSAHVLRQTFLTRMVRQGSDLALVAELAGHGRLERTRRYGLPSDADRLLAVERLQVDV
jgi:integrase/recombinase XerC